MLALSNKATKLDTIRDTNGNLVAYVVDNKYSKLFTLAPEILSTLGFLFEEVDSLDPGVYTEDMQAAIKDTLDIFKRLN